MGSLPGRRAVACSPTGLRWSPAQPWEWHRTRRRRVIGFCTSSPPPPKKTPIGTGGGSHEARLWPGPLSPRILIRRPLHAVNETSIGGFKLRYLLASDVWSRTELREKLQVAMKCASQPFLVSSDSGKTYFWYVRVAQLSLRSRVPLQALGLPPAPAPVMLYPKSLPRL